jgi:hypothetical protein
MPLDHYVSRVHLKRFYAPKLGNRMYAIRKTDLKRFTPDAKSGCRVVDGSTNPYLQNERAIEEVLRVIEPRYNAATETLRQGKIDPRTVFVLAGFVAYIVGCSPASMRMTSGLVGQAVQMYTTAAEEAGNLPQPPAGAAQTLEEMFQSGKIRVQVDPKYPQSEGINVMLRHITALGNFSWEALINPFDDSPFFTSDFPVAFEAGEQPRSVNRVVPLTPDLALRIRPDLSFNWRDADESLSRLRFSRHRLSRSEVHRINTMIVRAAEDLVFFYRDIDWIPRFVERNRNYRSDNVREEIPARGGSLVVFRHQIVPFDRAANSKSETVGT